VADSAPGTGSDADRSAITGLAQRVVRAWANHDADAFAGWFVEDATMILPGVSCDGREQIRAHMAAEFDGELGGSLITGQLLELRFLCREVAVLVSEGGILGPGQTEVAADQAIRAVWLWVKQQGQWRLACYQNTPRHRPGPSHPCSSNP